MRFKHVKKYIIRDVSSNGVVSLPHQNMSVNLFFDSEEEAIDYTNNDAHNYANCLILTIIKLEQI